MLEDMFVSIPTYGYETLSLLFFFSGYSTNTMGIFKDCGCGCKGAKAQQKFLISLMSALVFFVIANPDTFRLTRRVFGTWVSTPTGCPSARGLVLHTIVFLLVTWGMMNIKKEKYEIQENVRIKVKDTIAPSPEDEDVGPSAPPPMVEAPTPLPGFGEDQFAMIDSGLELGSLDITTEVDQPAAIEKDVSCQCDDGKTVTIRG
jgi:hypothetical protein